MKRIVLLIAVTAFLTACSDNNGENNKVDGASRETGTKKEDSKLSISIGKDSAGVTTKTGTKVQAGKDGGSVDNKDVKIKVKRDTTPE